MDLTAGKMTMKVTDVLSPSLLISFDEQHDRNHIQAFISFLTRETALNIKDLDIIWTAQNGRDEFHWSKANYDERRETLSKMLGSIKECKSEKTVGHKILKYIWNLAHQEDISATLMEKLLSCHVKVLESHSKGSEMREVWLYRSISELKSNEKWFVPALKLITGICCLYRESVNGQRSQNEVSREEIIERLENRHFLIDLISSSLELYVDQAKEMMNQTPNLDPKTFCIDNRYNHESQIQSRLSLLTLLLEGGKYCLTVKSIFHIWNSLIEKPLFDRDPDCAFIWLSNMTERHHLSPECRKILFQEKVVQLDPLLLNNGAMTFFEIILKSIDNDIWKRSLESEEFFINERPELVGIDYLRKLVENPDQEISDRAKQMLQIAQVNAVINTEELEKILECPVCLQRLSMPVHICFRGHAICNECIDNLYKCPTCNADFVAHRNTILNKLFEIIPASCKYRSNGCSETMPIPQIAKHETTYCDYRLVKCVCNVRDFVCCHLGKHFHRHAFKSAADFLSWQTVKIERSMGISTYRVCFIREDDSFFLFRCVADWEAKKFYVCVNFIGKRKDSMKYIYDVRINQEQSSMNDCYFFFSGICLPYIENENEIREHKKVFAIELKKVLFTNEELSDFDVEMRIKKRAVPVRKPIPDDCK